MNLRMRNYSFINPLIMGMAAITMVTVSCYHDNEEFAYKDTDFTSTFRTTEGWIAGDGAFSVPVDRERSLWLFGDSYMDCLEKASGTVPCLFQARNAAMLMGIGDPSEKTTLRNSRGDRTLFTLGSNSKYWFWPSTGFTHKDTIYVFQTRLRSTPEGGMWGFEGVDSNYVSKIPVNDMSVIEYCLMPASNGISFGISFIDEGRFTYVYGIRSNGFGNDLFVARFRKGNIYSPWSYFNGAGWVNNIKEISKIHSAFTASFFITEVKDKIVLLTTEFSVNCDQGKTIYSSVSKKPWGPFTGEHSVWQVDDTLEGHYPFFYAVAAHPEYGNGRKELLITYCINSYGDCLETCINNRMDPDVYRPKAIRVPFRLLY
jgi:hypothetical protein